MATMSFPFQPQIPYRAAAHVRRPLKSSIHPASEGSRRLVQYVFPLQYCVPQKIWYWESKIDFTEKREQRKIVILILNIASH